jgi:hypothetical protein
MAETVFRGPGFVAGSMEDGRVESMDGPSITYQADSFPDIRFWPTRKDGLYPGRVPAFLNSPYVVVVDNCPQAASATALVNAQNPVAATPFTLAAGATAQANGAAPISNVGFPTMSPGVPLVPLVVGSNGSMSWSGALVNVLALDFGFTSGTTTAAANTIAAADSTLFYPGQWICVGGAGNSGKTAPMIAQVASIAVTNTTTGAGTLTLQGGSLNGVAAASVTNAPIGSVNLPGPLPGTGASVGAPLSYVPTSVFPFLTSGLGSLLNPPEAIARSLVMVGQAGASANNITVNGYDIYGMKMTETQALNGATVVFFKKAFKYIASIVPSVSDGSHTINIGITDNYGYHLRTDKYEYTQNFWNGAYLGSNSASYLPRIITPATASTGDVRGTFQTSNSVTTGGPLGAGGATGTSSSQSAPAVRLLLALTVPLWNDLTGTPINPVPMFGVTQF